MDIHLNESFWLLPGISLYLFHLWHANWINVGMQTHLYPSPLLFPILLLSSPLSVSSSSYPLPNPPTPPPHPSRCVCYWILGLGPVLICRLECSGVCCQGDSLLCFEFGVHALRRQWLVVTMRVRMCPLTLNWIGWPSSVCSSSVFPH